MAGPEAKIERKATHDAEHKLGIMSVKWGVDGWPDRIFLMPGGRPFFIEFKAPGEEPDPRQQFRIECLVKWGYDVEVHDDSNLAIQAIARRLEAAKLSKESGKVSTRARLRRPVS